MFSHRYESNGCERSNLRRRRNQDGGRKIRHSKGAGGRDKENVFKHSSISSISFYSCLENSPVIIHPSTSFFFFFIIIFLRVVIS